MAASSRTRSDVRTTIHNAHKNKVNPVVFYNGWAEDYEQDVGLFDYKAPRLAAECLSSSFEGDREKAVVLDVACGTGLACESLQQEGFQHFVGLDGSDRMLEVAKRKRLYQELKQCIMGNEALPVKAGTYDVVLAVGALSSTHVPFTVVRQLWAAAKPGGYVCITTRGDETNREYKNNLEDTLREMEKEGLWTRISITEVEDWEKRADDGESEYIPGAVYLFRKLEK